MPNLTLKLKNRTLGSYPLRSGLSLAIGRRSSNDIVIVNLGVSGYHAEIITSPRGFLLRDLDSKNGTLVNGQPVTSRVLAHGDIITIGKHSLVFENQDQPGSVPGQAADAETLVFENPDEMVDKTIILDTTRIPGYQQGGTAGEEGAGPEIPLTGILSILSQGRRFPLTKNLVKIGRSRTSDIVVTGFSRWLAGGTSATIARRPDGYYISHVSGLLKTRVNNVRLSGTRKLSGFDRITIGALDLQFIEKHS